MTTTQTPATGFTFTTTARYFAYVGEYSAATGERVSGFRVTFHANSREEAEQTAPYVLDTLPASPFTRRIERVRRAR